MDDNNVNVVNYLLDDRYLKKFIYFDVNDNELSYISNMSKYFTRQ